VLRHPSFAVFSLALGAALVGASQLAAQQTDAPLGPSPFALTLSPNGSSIALAARAEVAHELRPEPLGSYRLGAALAMPTRSGSVWVSYRASVSPFELSTTSAGDSGRVAWRTTSMRQGSLHELTLGASRRIRQVALSISGGGAHGVMRNDETSPGRMVYDSVWTDTSGWVPTSHREGGGQAVSRLVPARWMTGELYASWMRERFGLGAGIGGRMSSGRARSAAWGTLELAARVQPNLWFVAASGVRPDATRASGAGGRYSTIGMRFSYGSRLTKRSALTLPEAGRAFAIARIDSSVYRISLLAPGAKRVELSADFSRWSAIQLAPGAGGLWTADVHVVPGAYRVNVRIDGGAWKAPPGTATIADDFGGSAGLVVVPDR
jgi:hypothetical protein